MGLKGTSLPDQYTRTRASPDLGAVYSVRILLAPLLSRTFELSIQAGLLPSASRTTASLMETLRCPVKSPWKKYSPRRSTDSSPDQAEVKGP